jgi:hypothetical protein
MPSKKTEAGQQKSVEKKTITAKNKSEKPSFSLPEAVMASCDDGLKISLASSECSVPGETRLRRNSASGVTKLDRFSNIEHGVAPFVYGSGSGKYDANISARDAIILCQKAYWNVPVFRNNIDLMTEFSLSDVYLTGGNEQSRKFFQIWLNKINCWSVQDQFYRELYRSGNIFIYKFRADFGRDGMMKIQEAFGAKKAISGKSSIPIKYIILNPADINVIKSSSFLDSVYVKYLNDYEVESLLNPKTEADKELSQKIPEIRELLKDKSNKVKSFAGFGSSNVSIEIDRERLIAIFYKKQNYEPLSVPMGFAVLEDINSKLELKKIDQAIARSVQQAVLLITMGDEKVGMPSAQNLTAMRRLFENQSVGKVLVADYTTNAKFVVPDIGNLLDPKKYTILDNDIRMGLNSILFGEEKFSSASTKVKVFFARLKYGREKFLRDFLIPEMKEVGKKLGFKKIPEPKLEDVDFEDNVLMSRVYSRLIELGVLTPEEAFEVFESGRLPSSEESVQSQKKFKELRDLGYYQPITGAAGSEKEDGSGGGISNSGTTKNTSKDLGRPSGTDGIKQSVKRTASASTIDGKKISLDRLKTVMSCISSLELEIQKLIKAKFKIKKLNKDQLEVVSDLALVVMQNERMENWNFHASQYVQDPSASNAAFFDKIDSLAASHGLDIRSACILYHSHVD